jgi:small subunit ribosomal protein S16
MLMIRFQRIGRTNDPAFRIVLLEKERAAKAGGITELLGTYNPRSKALTLKEERVKYWISKGAQPTDSIHNLLISKGVIEGKKINVLPKKTVAKVAPTSEVGVPTEASGKSDEPSVESEASGEAPKEEVVTEEATQTSETESVVPAEALPTEEQVAAEAEPAPEEESKPAPETT